MYDVIVLGGGPGGYLAAERAAQAGLKTLCIEDTHLGGTCLNEGCIPTKTLLHSAKLYAHAARGEVYGVRAGELTIDHSAVIDRKDRVVAALVGGVSKTLKSCGAEVISQRGTLLGREGEGIAVRAGEEVYSARHVILATGSSCLVPPIPGLREGLADGSVVTNREMLQLRRPPRRLTVLGGGVIGLEMASYYQMTGTQVTVVEMLDHIGGPNDRDLTKILLRNYRRDGMKVELSARVTAVDAAGVHCRRQDEDFTVEGDLVLLALGRRPNTAGLGLEQAGVLVERGAVVTDSAMRTNVPGIYAVGDINGKFMLAHTAYREAEVAVHTILGKTDTMRYDAVPSVLYTVPELASVGMTEEEARAAGRDAAVVRIPMQFSGRYLAENEGGDGICKLVFDRRRDTLLGAHVLANSASEFIVAAAMAIEMELRAADLQEIIFPHPTVSEILREAACRYQNA